MENSINNIIYAIYEEPVMHSKSDNTEIMINGEADEVIKDLLIHLKIDIKINWNQWKVSLSKQCNSHVKEKNEEIEIIEEIKKDSQKVTAIITE